MDCRRHPRATAPRCLLDEAHAASPTGLSNRASKSSRDTFNAKKAAHDNHLSEQEVHQAINKFNLQVVALRFSFTVHIGMQSLLPLELHEARDS